MSTPSNNSSSLEASPKITKMEDIPEPLLWRGQPNFQSKAISWGIIGILLATVLFIIIVIQDVNFSLDMLIWLTVLSIFVGAISLILAIVGWIRTVIKKQTHYGISPTAVWIKPYNKAVEKYPIVNLEKISLQGQSIYCVDNKQNSQQELVVLEQVSDASTAYELLLKLQQENQ